MPNKKCCLRVLDERYNKCDIQKNIKHWQRIWLRCFTQIFGSLFNKFKSLEGFPFYEKQRNNLLNYLGKNLKFFCRPRYWQRFILVYVAIKHGNQQQPQNVELHQPFWRRKKATLCQKTCQNNVSIRTAKRSRQYVVVGQLPKRYV